MTPQIYSLLRHGKVLATRSLGSDVAADLRTSDPERPLLVVDFKDIRVASSPFLDEVAIGLRAMIADHPDRFVLLANLNEDLVDTLELVVKRRDIVLTAVRGGDLTTVGGSRQLDETLRAAEELGTFTASELADRLELKLPNLHQRLGQLEAAGALTRQDDPSARRGRRLIFKTPKIDDKTLAGTC